MNRASSSFWAITAAEELADIKPINTYHIKNYAVQTYQTSDSLWAMVQWPSGSKVAFRMACLPGSQLSLIKTIKKETGFTFSLSATEGDLLTELQFPADENCLMRYTTKFIPKTALNVPFWPKDILPLTNKGSLQQEGTIHAQQVGTRSGLLHFSMDKPQTGTVFYFQNLTAINAYFEITKTSAADTVGGIWPELGFSLPTSDKEVLEAGKEFTLNDAFVVLSDVIPVNEVESTQQFLNLLATTYQQLERPAPKYFDWMEIGKAGLDGLSNHKGCWTFAGGHPYLNAYLADYKTPPEIMVQLAVMVPLLEYCNWAGIKDKMVDELHDGLPAFYDENLKTLVRWLPAMQDNLDKSEEQKRERIMDSWYLHHPLMNLTRLAANGDQMAKTLVDKSIDFVINVAHHFNYEWPVFYRMDTLEVTKAETAEGAGGEKDVPGAYAKLMMELWGLTKKQRYLTEAKKAVKHLKGLGFDIFYQANNTAFAAVALVRLYKQTKEKWYLDLSYCCIAAILKNAQLWDCNYGNGKYFPTFFSIFPLKDAPYTAAYEEQEVYSTLHGYLQETVDIEILPSVRLLLGELVRYATARIPFYYPTLLPKEILATEINTGEIDPNLWIPLEDIHDGWEASGSVGQEVYGACASFGIIPRQYFKVPNQDFMLFVDYPSVDFKTVGKKALTMRLLGHISMECTFIILLGKKDNKKNFSLKVYESARKTKEIKPTKSTADQIRFYLKGDQQIRLEWS